MGIESPRFLSLLKIGELDLYKCGAIIIVILKCQSSSIEMYILSLQLLFEPCSTVPQSLSSSGVLYFYSFRRFDGIIFCVSFYASPRRQLKEIYM
jgi:hypothetical protein